MFSSIEKAIQAFVDAKFFRQYVDREEKLYELSREVITHTTRGNGRCVDACDQRGAFILSLARSI